MQVIKDPIGTKGARLSTQIIIAGRMLVFLPQDEHIGISQKIGSPELREQLRARMQALVGDGGGGFILRTNAEEASDAELADDIAYLRKTWAGDPRARRQASPPGTLLHQDLSLAERVLRDLSQRRHADHPHRLARCSSSALQGLRRDLHAARGGQARAVHAASGRSSTCSTSRTRSRARWRAASS